MESRVDSESTIVTSTTSAFVFSAAIVIMTSTVLACAKDEYPPLKAALKSLAGHDWTAQGMIDLAPPYARPFMTFSCLPANTGT